MFFILSKILAFFIVPINFLFVLTLLWWFSSVKLSKPVLSKCLMYFTLITWLVVGYYPVPDYLLSQLENTYPQTKVNSTDLVGVIVLGGGEGKGTIAKARNEASLSRAAERLSEAAKLSKQNPQLKVLYTGHTSKIFHIGWSGSDIAKKFLSDQGVPADKILLEGRSRNTYENAVLSKTFLEQAENQGRWGLITSAAHMNRSMKIFEKVGLGDRLTPIPVDYETSGEPNWWRFDLKDGNDLWRNYLHETIGTWVYRLTGKL
ncbi:MAG: YdcF family protein [Leucothrix sp.]